MNTLPSLSLVFSGHTDFQRVETPSQNTQQNGIQQPDESQHKASDESFEKNEQDMFNALKVVNKIDLKAHAYSNPGYAWKVYKKTSSSTLSESSIEEKKVVSIPDETTKNQSQALNAGDHLEEAKPTESYELDNCNADSIEDFENKSWMQDPKSNKSRPKSIPDKKLAVRSDVVNKTLLRSLKRYYTAKFEELTQGKFQGKSAQKDELYSKLREFTESVYKGDHRFNYPEFSDVKMEDLVFFNGIWINPFYMKRTASSPQERTKFQNFNNCLYKYSHKKLLKLFSSNVLHFMFRKFFEDGPFEHLLMHDKTLKKNPEVYKKASENFLNLFRENSKPGK